MDKIAWHIAVLFAGSALGGYYLGGYEWLRFFTFFGSWGTIGIALSALGLGWFGVQLFTFCHRKQIRSLYELYYVLCGEAFASSLSVITHILLLGYAGVMLGQQAEFLLEGVSPLWFILLSIAVIFFIINRWRWIVTATALSLSVGLLFFGVIFGSQSHVPIPNLGYQMNLNWIIHAVFFLALHFLISLATTLPLAVRAASERTVQLGAVIGATLFFLFTMLGQAILLAHWHDAHASVLPVKQILMLMMTGGDWLLAILSLAQGGVILAALLYSLAHPIATRQHLQMLPLIVVMLLTVFVFAITPLVIPWSVSVVASGATYCGMFLMGWYVWKRQV
ncbi:hypothetical protein [Brevibacillus sp. 179-C 1.1 NHS]|uniref:hypothetical protein n=1 Tax=Brevibacillus sp. 179-C 1.1 NHS TaxID=3235177 RepID=UPI0039A3D1EB